MNSLVFFLTAAILFFAAASTNTSAVAQSNYNVIIPDGAANSYAPFFWQNELDGSTTGIIEILPGDTVTWKNVDSAVHTVTSGIAASRSYDGVFDSGLFGPGKSFSHTFDQPGEYHYYCIPHLWMVGTVIVANDTTTTGVVDIDADVDDDDDLTANDYSIIPNVGKQIGDGSVFYDLEYDFDRTITLSEISEEEKSITLEITDNYNGDRSDDTNNNNNNNNIKPLTNDLTLRFPSALIDGGFVIFADGTKPLDYDQNYNGTHYTLDIILSEDSKLLTVMGTSIVPEFGSAVVLLFVVSLVIVAISSQRLKLRLPY